MSQFSGYGRRQPPFAARPRHNPQEPPFRRSSYQQHQYRSQFPPNNYDRPPGDIPARPNFIVQLRPDSQKSNSVRRADAEAVIRKLKFQPQRANFVMSNFNSASLSYEQWSETLATIVQLWEMKLGDKGFSFVPRLVSNVELPSDRLELNDRLKVLFIEKLKRLKEGELVEKWEKKLGTVMDEVKRISRILSDKASLRVFNELLEKKEVLVGESTFISNRIEEFRTGIRCIEEYLEDGNKEEHDFEVLRFVRGKIEWGRIYCLMMRECRRLDDGLPIYSHRQAIMKQIHCQQVTVLVGETGSGKSTQLVQFLVDSGICGDGAIICTQPRKLAAITLAERVKEESFGCYDDTSVVCYPSYSSLQEFESNVVFATDHCLLQHYISDNQLSMISCIVVDEAHERSLNTDLLLALIKTLLCQRPCLRLIIMSATVDADQFSDYFFGCRTLHVTGRHFPVAVKYEPCHSEVSPASKLMPSYVHDVLNTVLKINRTEREGTILAFLTSQSEVEWACENFQAPYAVALPLHGKLSYEDQHRVFLAYPGKRKVIFATNVAETSLTIPGVKYVVDPGMVKESMYEPATGMNILKVGRISQSSAKQRAGRAGRTEPGTCYRLYSEDDFESMLPHQEPEIRKVHLGVAILKIMALGVKDLQEFDFVDAPSASSIDLAVRNLVQLGAIVLKNGAYELTTDGKHIVKLGIEPRLGKIILQSFRQQLGKEGLVLAAVMANSSSIFCRVGTVDAKLKSDSLKVRFCHPTGDLFTLLGVYREWESVPREKRNTWCWENSINAKTLRRCQDTVIELEACLKNEMNIIVPNYWYWNPQIHGEHDKILKNVILSSLPGNVAMYSGHDQLGYEVALTRKHVQLHPACSLFNFGQRPAWVVFSEIISVSNEYLTCVTACDFDYFSTLSPSLPFDFLVMNSQRLHKRVLSGFGSVQLKRFCGKSNSNVRFLESKIRESYADERIGVVVDVDQNEVLVYASSQDIEKVMGLVIEALEYEKKLLQNECVEEFMYGPKVLNSIALFGAGAEIKHLELEKRCLSVDIYHSNASTLDQKELLLFLESFTSGFVCSVSRLLVSGPENEEKDKWGRVTFLTPDAAEKAAVLNEIEFSGGLLKIIPSMKNHDSDLRMMSSNRIKAKISWPRRRSKGIAFVKCNPDDVDAMVNDLSNLVIGDRFVWCRPSDKFPDSIKITGLDRDLSQEDIRPVIRAATSRHITDFFLLLENANDDLLPLPPACEDAILREISPFMPRRNKGVPVNVKVFPPEAKDSLMRAQIDFDGSLHLEAARALEHIDRKVLPGCDSWQKIVCHRVFDGSVYCPPSVYHVIGNEFHHFLRRLRHDPHYQGVEWNLEKTHNGGIRVKISASATRLVFELKNSLSELVGGTIIHHPDITPSVLQILFSRDGVLLMKSVERGTGTQIFFDKQKMTLRVYGPPEKIGYAQQNFVRGLLALHDSRQLEIRLRDGVLPPDMMKRVVQHFGPDLCGLRDKVPGVELSLNVRRHTISIVGNKALKQEVENIIHDLAQPNELQILENDYHSACPICLCEVEDSYMLEGCHHKACRSCLVEQCESAIRNRDCFPLLCAKEGCRAPILVADLRSLFPERLHELFQASLGAYVAASGGALMFCPSTDCPSVYRVVDPSGSDAAFRCGVCFMETCMKCHMEYHPLLSCEKYREFKADPDSSLKEWCMGKENVKTCPGCGSTVEKVDGCNHVECRCGRHVCWVCLDSFDSSDDCYSHLRSAHPNIEVDMFEFDVL
ncbi:ATP-dependent RNA helicase DEAH12, chloroplastic-like [Salvia hispanica]|uniref:ATP-dependent RNA helicase DEAH12, chloroplastic-like n=1 Tax=Salvia hispanica TaxID=49212 RepID=UPI0020096E84|nr:ATP-dependent RNA helicase DEAH12, chloroplastic-like [Salvia hispanica]XP_047952891.1 ATP-dependent RNA helicase DEAH12, chloroplastic-like [Salvia hispanica]